MQGQRIFCNEFPPSKFVNGCRDHFFLSTRWSFDASPGSVIDGISHLAPRPHRPSNPRCLVRRADCCVLLCCQGPTFFQSGFDCGCCYDFYKRDNAKQSSTISCEGFETPVNVGLDFYSRLMSSWIGGASHSGVYFCIIRGLFSEMG